MKSKFLHKNLGSKFQKTLLITVFVLLNFASKAQFYAFAKSTGTYTELSGATTLLNGNWDDFSMSFKTPFTFRYFTLNIFDSIEVTDWAGIYFNNINNGLFDIYSTNLNSRGNNKSPVSYLTTGITPNRILKVQYKNAGFVADAPNFSDSVNFQLWIYETSNIIEFRYGPNQVKSTSFNGENGPYVQVADPLSISTNFIVLEGNPASPTVRTSNIASSTTLNGSPANGTIYRFTPSQFHTGITDKQNNQSNISAIDKVVILSMSGQIITSFSGNEIVDLNYLPSGIYIMQSYSKDGIVTTKFAR